MIQKENKKIEWSLIARKLKGAPLTEQEEADFQEWVKQENHAVYFRKAQQMWDAEEFDTPHADLDALMEQFDASTSPQKSRPLYRHVYYIRYAAAILLIGVMGFSAFWLIQDQRTQQEHLAQTEVKAIDLIQPGKPQAVLVLADGKQIGLEETHTQQTIQEESNHSIEIKGHTLTYTSNPTEQVETYNTLMIPRGGEYCLELSDGTKIWLNSNTQLRYPTQFLGDKRIVELKGEAYFEVKTDAKRPFIVQTSRANIQVHGTAFNVRAFEHEAIQHTTLAEGKVSIDNAGKLYPLTPGQQARIGAKELEIKEVNPAVYCSWYKGQFIFENQPLEEILNQLADWYDVNIVYENDSLKQLHFTGDLERSADFADILSLIKLTTNVEFSVSGQTVTVHSKTKSF